MEALFNPQELKQKIQLAKPALAKRGTLPILEMVKLKAHNNILHVTASDQDIVINTHLDYQGDSFDVCVNPDKITPALGGGIKAFNINGNLQIKSSYGSFTIPVIQW